MNLSISLAPDGALRLHLPSGRFLDIATEATERVSCTECGEAFRTVRESVALRSIKRILREAVEPARERRGYIGLFPTQEIIEAWLREDRARDVADERKKLEDKYGVDVDKLDIEL